MSRSRSNQSSSSNPFTGTSALGPCPIFVGVPEENVNPALEMFTQNSDVPYAAGIPRPRPHPLAPRGGEDPCDFLVRRGYYSVACMSPTQQFLAPNCLISPLEDSQTTPAMSQIATMTSSHQAENSSTSDPISAGCVKSCTSNVEDPELHENANLYSSDKSAPANYSLCEDILAKVGGAPSLQVGDLNAATSQPMSRSQTNNSTRSTRSNLSIRAKESLSQQNHRAITNPLKPKTAATKTCQAEIEAASSKKKETVEKPSYQRPKHPRVLCKVCGDYPEGFRGEHELRRHYDAKHAQVVTKWVCCDAGPTHQLQPIVPINKCKACQMQKQYGAYYNAAAHLRRAHFNKKTGGRRSRGTEPRTGGQEWPLMDDLKPWFFKIRVPRSEKQDPNTPQTSLDDIPNPDDSLASNPAVGAMAFANTDPVDQSSLATVGDSGLSTMANPGFRDLVVDTQLSGDASDQPSTGISPNVGTLSMFTPSPPVLPLSDIPGYALSPSTLHLTSSGTMADGYVLPGIPLLPNSFEEKWVFENERESPVSN